MTHVGNVIDFLLESCVIIQEPKLGSGEHLSVLIATRNTLVLIFPSIFFQFMQDASDVMQLLLKTQTDFSDMEDDDPQVKQLSHVRLDVHLV